MAMSESLPAACMPREQKLRRQLAALPGELLVCLCSVLFVAGIALLTALPLLITLQQHLMELPAIHWQHLRFTPIH